MDTGTRRSHTAKRSAFSARKMRDNLAQVKSIVQEKNANLDVEIIRRDRAILYRIQPRKVLTVRNEALKWKRSAPADVEELINTALERNGPQPSTKVFA